MKGKLIDVRSIGLSIKALRVANHLTQEELADRVGYSVRNLRRIENFGTGSIEIINSFAETFNVSALDILNGCFLFIKKFLIKLLYKLCYYKITNKMSCKLEYIKNAIIFYLKVIKNASNYNI